MFKISPASTFSQLICDEVLFEDEASAVNEPYKNDSLFSTSPPLSPIDPSEWGVEFTAKRIESYDPLSKIAQNPRLIFDFEETKNESLNVGEILDQPRGCHTNSSENLPVEVVLDEEEEEEELRRYGKKEPESLSLERQFCQICQPTESHPWYRSPLLFLNPQKVNYLLAIQDAANTGGDVNLVNQAFGFCTQHGSAYLKALAEDPLTSIYLPQKYDFTGRSLF